MDFAATLRRVYRSLTLRREPFVWMSLNSEATGDALVVVVGSALVFLVVEGGFESFNLEFVLQVLLDWLIGWLIIAATTWAAIRFVFRADTPYADVLRVAGFAFPAWLLRLVTNRLVAEEWGLVLGSIWFLAVIAAGVRVLTGLVWERAWAAAALGFAGWLIIGLLFRAV